MFILDSFLFDDSDLFVLFLLIILDDDLKNDPYVDDVDGDGDD